jgi:hypothetical protein
VGEFQPMRPDEGRLSGLSGLSSADETPTN